MCSEEYHKGHETYDVQPGISLDRYTTLPRNYGVRKTDPFELLY